MPFDKIQLLLEANPEYAWFLIFLFGFMESMIITGSFMPSAILFSVCIYLYNTELLTLPWICGMITLIIAFLSIVALLFLVQQLLSNAPDGKMLKSIRDLLVIILALSISIGVFYVGFRLVRFLL
jgi:hypothetical protein